MSIRRRSIRVVLAAGGTGGHMFPAHVLGEELRHRGHDLVLISDRRGLRFRALFSDMLTYQVVAATFAGQGIFGKIKALFKLVQGTFQARELLKGLNPAIVVGFGGYPSLPTLVAALTLGIPTILHEQNAVLGRVNRRLASFVSIIALSFKNTRRLPSGRASHLKVTGNPVRGQIIEIGEKAYPPLDDTRYFNLLVLGGSQGASILSTVVPAAISALPKALRRRLHVVQQCREEDLSKVRDIYREFGVKSELAAFIEDVPAELVKAHLVIGRAGASTVTEISAAGRPAIFVPLPSATDDHQSANAADLAETGGGWIIPQRSFGTASLAKLLQGLATNPDRLQKAAVAARSLARPKAARDLADMVEQLAIADGSVPEPKNRQATDGGNDGTSGNIPRMRLRMKCVGSDTFAFRGAWR